MPNNTGIVTEPGMRFGRLVVVNGSERRPRKTPKKPNGTEHFIKCKCDCGVESFFRKQWVVSGRIKSCGCASRVASGLSVFKHGDSPHKLRTSEYKAWLNIIHRCVNTNCHAYFRYGGRGITICDIWRNDYGTFLADMGRKPSPQHSIDRIDNEKGYSPENCKWSSWKEQARNRNNTRILSYEGESKPISDWADLFGFTRGMIIQRLNRGWDAAKALTTPARIRKT